MHLQSLSTHMQSLSTLNPNLLRGFNQHRRHSLFSRVWRLWRGFVGPRRRSRMSIQQNLPT